MIGLDGFFNDVTVTHKHFLGDRHADKHFRAKRGIWLVDEMTSSWQTDADRQNFGRQTFPSEVQLRSLIYGIVIGSKKCVSIVTGELTNSFETGHFVFSIWTVYFIAWKKDVKTLREIVLKQQYMNRSVDLLIYHTIQILNYTVGILFKTTEITITYIIYDMRCICIEWPLIYTFTLKKYYLINRLPLASDTLHHSCFESLVWHQLIRYLIILPAEKGDWWFKLW